MRSSLRIRRRDLLRASAAAGVALAFPFPAIAQQKSPNEKLSIAGIGAGGQGGWDIGNCAGENIIVLCDVDDRRCEASVQRFPKAKRYRDFRKMFEEMGKQIDAVVVGTPDHTHAPAAAMAMRLGKHCYCEKPLTHTVYEARVLGGHRPREEAGHPDGHADPRRGKLPARRGIGPGRRDRPGPRSPRLAGGELRRAAQAGQPPAVRCSQGRAARPRDARLGPVARARAVSAVQRDLRAVPVALLVGVRQRHPGGFLLPLLRPGVSGR